MILTVSRTPASSRALMVRSMDSHGGGQQSGHAQDVGFVLFYCFDESFWLNILAEVNDLKTSAFAHHANQVFANIMQVAFDCPQQDLAEQSLPRIPPAWGG